MSQPIKIDRGALHGLPGLLPSESRDRLSEFVNLLGERRSYTRAMFDLIDLLRRHRDRRMDEILDAIEALAFELRRADDERMDRMRREICAL